MKLFPLLLWPLFVVCLPAQTPVQQPPPKPQAAPPEGINVPLEIIPQQPAADPNKVLVQVNDIRITAGQVDEVLAAYPENMQVFARGPGRQQFIDQMVRTLVLSEEGKRRKMDEQSIYKTQTMFQDAAIMAGLVSKEITNATPVDEESLRKYYADHKAEYEQVGARHILIRMQGSPVPLKPGQKDLTDAEALDKAQELFAKIKGGADFGELAKAESDDPGSAAKGGDLGMFGHGKMVAPVEEAAFKLAKPGDVSEPVKSPFGYHLIQLQERESKSFDELKPEIEKKVRPLLVQKQIDELINKTKVILDPEVVPSSKIPK